MVFRSYELEKNLLWYKVEWETIAKYKQWVQELINYWWKIRAIVCDGKRWLLGWFGSIPTQMCHFHQKQIMTRYLTRKPKLEQNIDLKEISKYIWKLRENTLRTWLEDWIVKNKERLQEKNDSWKYVHERTRKAYKSLLRNLPYLYTYERHKDIPIPNTTNHLDWWVFSRLKERLWNHRWLKQDRKQKWIEWYINYS